jgi:hypothetical protein
VSVPLIVVVTLIYASVAIDQYRQGEVGLAGMWLGYALANGGLIYHMTMKG